MKITGFDISNFKGVRNARIRFSDNDIARVHTLVGLNESGKTTLLEALHSFAPDFETSLVVKNAWSIEEQREQWIPRDQISNFTGEVSITAYIHATDADWTALRSELEKTSNLVCRDSSFAEHFSVRLVHKYENGDFITTIRNVNLPDFRVKSKRAKKYRQPNPSELRSVGSLIRRALPTVAYYPTFVFDFPKKIYLTGKDSSPRNRFYRQLFQDILDYDGSGYSIEDSIVSRLHKEETKGFWEQWFSAFVGTTEEDKVKQVISRAERAVTKMVFSRWNEVFGEDVGDKEVKIDLQYEKGKVIKNEDGIEEEPTEHDAYIRFRVKDGSSLYSVEDRSLGFRWFFSFLLFTQFRIHREKNRATIFLFDEPASNLHAAAQKKLLESFPAIAKAPHRLIYSTHSHYMVEPRWLEQAYIVYDKSTVPDSKIIDDSVKSDSSVDIQVVPYRRFVSEQPGKTSYFQPILDTLDVQPSKFDYEVGGLIVEGKGDYYYLRLCLGTLNKEIGPIFPSKGSGTMGALVALHRGWGLPVRVVFDTDRGGEQGKRNLMKDLSIREDEIIDLKQLVPEMKRIEDVLTEEDQEKWVKKNTKNRKTVLLRQVQEAVASGDLPNIGRETKSRMKRLVDGLDQFLAEGGD